MFHSPLALFGLALVAVVSCVALIVGGSRERLGAVLYLGCYVAVNALAYVAVRRLSWWETGLDVGCLLGFVALAWKSPHPWPLWAAGFQAASLMVDVQTLANVHILSWTYITIITALGYGVEIAVLVGAIASWRQQTKKV